MSKSHPQNIAIFFSINYPFHYADSYVDEEVNLWAPQFDKVIIVSLNQDDSLPRPTPPNATTLRFRPAIGIAHYFRSIPLLFSGLFRKEVSFVSRGGSGKWNLGKLKSIFKYYARSLAYRDFLEEKLQSFQGNQVMVYSYFMLESMLAACSLKEKYQLKLISRLHGYDLYFERGEYGYLPFRGFMAEKIDRLFFISANGLNYFKQKVLGRNPNLWNKLALSRLGIAPAGDPDLSFRPMNPFTIVSTSWILANKRVDLIAKALSFLPADCRVKWVHFGGAQNIDSDYAGDFLTLVKEVQLNKKNIEIDLRGNTPKEEIFDFFRNNYVHFFINVSASEGIPISMMEASCFGIPLLGTLVGGVGEIIQDGINGFHLQSNLTPNYLSHQFLRFMQLDEKEYLELRKNAYRLWKENFSSHTNYTQHAKDIASLLASKS
jgi:glycosyltransferase involved in cell wall biosynthesis